MTPLAPHVTAFFEERLTLERQASLNTCDSYAYAFKLLLSYANMRLKIAPSRLAFEQIDAPLVVGFLNDLESKRSNATSCAPCSDPVIHAVHGIPPTQRS